MRVFERIVKVMDVSPKMTTSTVVTLRKNDELEGVEKITSPLEPKMPAKPPPFEL